jgi:glycosyltransferase involved in cell wall biosynthesis
MTDHVPGTPAKPACISAGAEKNHASDMGRDLDGPVVSVCMPAYNCQRYVAEAIESILGQTFRDFEFLIIDDGSTDGSLPILRRYAARDPRIRLTSRPNLGVPATLKELVDQSRGEFIARMDADDIAFPERFEKQVNYLRAHSDCVVVGCRVWETDAEGDSVREYFTLADHDEIDAFHFRMTGPALVHPSIMLRRDAMLAVGGYRNFLIEDLDLYLRLAEYGRIARVPEFLLKYRIHSTNLSFSAPFWERSYPVLCEILTDTYQRRNLPVRLPPPKAVPASPSLSAAEKYLTIGWESLLCGHLRTARKYARRLLIRRPLARESWRLMYCALRGN